MDFQPTFQKQATYFKQLDGLRFVAVSLVLCDHWSGDSLAPASYLGVCLFFVLSGFLITRILLNAKSKDEEKTAIHLLSDKWQLHRISLRQFYIRRSIRIFPVYYLLIFVLFLLGVPAVREHWAWCISYSINIYVAIHHSWLGTIDHLWSLAVEEQFYLFFPFVIFFIPYRYLFKVLIGLIVLSLGLRLYFFVHNEAAWMTPYVLMPTCLDAFGMGGMLAYTFAQESTHKFITNKTYLLLSFCLYLGIVFLGKSISEGHNFVSIVLLRFFESLFSVFLVGNAAYGFAQDRAFGRAARALLENPVANYLGRISYGIYIYHNFVYNMYHTPSTHPTIKILNYLPFIQHFMPLKVLFLYVITVLVATVSWYAIEKPINRLKDKFQY